MKLTKFNPVQDAIQSQRGFQGMAYRRFRTAVCWVCQKDKPRVAGTSQITQGGNAAKSLKSGAPTKFICVECREIKAAASPSRETSPA